jgi:hypothetical protein
VIERPNFSEKNLLYCHFVCLKSHMDYLWTESSPHGEKLTTA